MLTTAVEDVRKMEVGCKLIPKKLGWLSVTQALSSLARLTLRQLRQMASDLGVTLYSRKSKEALVSAIAERQDRRDCRQDEGRVGKDKRECKQDEVRDGPRGNR